MQAHDTLPGPMNRAATAPRRFKTRAAVGTQRFLDMHQFRLLKVMNVVPQEKRLNRQRKGGKDAAPQSEEDAQGSDAARIEVLTAQLEAANAKLEDSAKRCNYLLMERVSAAMSSCSDALSVREDNY